MSHAAVAEAAEALNERFDLPERFESALPLALLVQNGHNARHRFDPVKLEELAASIREKGIIEPLVVRPFELHGKTHYEVVAGARRYRASKIAGRTHVPCVIREYSDSDVLELQIIENIQREDLDPLEEAAGYHALIESNKAKYSVAYIADRIGRRETYVWDTLRLLNLTDEAKQLLERGLITRSHAVVLAKLTPKQQEKIVDVDGQALWRPQGTTLDFEGKDADEYSGLKPCSVRELEAHIANHVRFNPKQAAEIAPLEFGETARLVDAAAAQPGRGRKVVSITHSTYVQPDAKDEDEKIVLGGRWKRADGLEDSKTCEHAVLGVIAVGYGYGQAFKVCIAKEKCDIHWKKERQEKAKRQQLEDGGEREKARQLADEQQKKRDEEERKRKEAEALWLAAQPDVVTALVTALKKARPGQLAEIVTDGCDRSFNRQFLKAARARIPAKTKADDILRQAALVVLLRELVDYQAPKNFPRRAREFGVDVAKILKAHTQQSKKAAKS